MKLELMRDKNKDFPVIDNPLQYTELKIWHCSYKTLAKIADFKNLEKIEIATVPDDNLSFLSDLSNLTSLRILHMPKVNSLESLSTLEHLEELSLETLPSWDSGRKKTIVASLKPLSRLRNLKTVILYGIEPEDEDYTCLGEVKVKLQYK